MRQDTRQELRKYQMDKIKPNFTELGRQLGCDPRTARKYYYLKDDGYENKRKRRQELRKYQMDKIKPNFTELGRQLGCDPRTARKYYYLKDDGYENKRKRRKENDVKVN